MPGRDEVVEQLANRLDPDPAHSRHVAALADNLFLELQPLHLLGPVERTTLRHAALLHDIGWSVGHAGHHKHSQRLILKHLGSPFTLEERRLIAAVARYHRKALPKVRHAVYADLAAFQRAICRQLAALLRVADALDRSHRCVVRQVVCEQVHPQVVLRLSTGAPAVAELSALDRKADLFRDVYGRDLIATVRSARAASEAS